MFYEIPAAVPGEIDGLASAIEQYRFASFSEYVDGEGEADICSIVERYRHVMDCETDKSYYFDWEASGLFSLAGKSDAECSAGPFDLARDPAVEVNRGI